MPPKQKPCKLEHVAPTASDNLKHTREVPLEESDQPVGAFILHTGDYAQHNVKIEMFVFCLRSRRSFKRWKEQGPDKKWKWSVEMNKGKSHDFNHGYIIISQFSFVSGGVQLPRQDAYYAREYNCFSVSFTHDEGTYHIISNTPV